jgi:tRNA pseudouridine32 synthase / 23S rRNA pseudouridine746 synthase
VSRPARPILPARAGVAPSTVVTPHAPPGQFTSLLDFLAVRFPFVGRVQWQQRLQEGLVLDDAGNALSAERPFEAGLRLHYYRSPGPEAPIPFEETVLFQDEQLVVADKPHFLPVVPSGGYLQETLLLRLKRRLGLPALSPLHRIDRDTAGLVLFSVDPSTRGAYQALFRTRAVHKTYQAVARWDPYLPWPLRRETRIGAGSHFMQQAEVAGAPNAFTEIRPLNVQGDWALYELQPLTGQRHQLRVHMNALGLPILGDGIYPVLTPAGQTDFSHPLQLLACTLAFTDPLSGQTRHFQTERHLLPLPKNPSSNTNSG